MGGRSKASFPGRRIRSNTMVQQLASFASEVTRVAREVGTEGKLGGQADVKGVSGYVEGLDGLGQLHGGEPDESGAQHRRLHDVGDFPRLRSSSDGARRGRRHSLLCSRPHGAKRRWYDEFAMSFASQHPALPQLGEPMTLEQWAVLPN